MSAFVKFKSGFSFEFHVGAPIRGILRDPLDWLDVVAVQCDGHELDQACAITGKNVPSCVFTFVGDEARSIFVNWR